MITKDNIKEEIKYLMIAFPNYNPTITGSPNVIDVFMDILGDCEAEVLHKAVKSCIRDNGRVFAPSVGEILERIRMYVIEEKGKFVPTPEPLGGWADLTGITNELFGDKND